VSAWSGSEEDIVLLVITLLCFCAAAALVLALVASFERNPLRERLLRLQALGTTAPRPEEARGILVDERTGVAGRALSALAGSGVDPSSPALAKVRQRLIQAGHRRPAALRIYLGSRVALAAALPLLVLNMPATHGLDPARLTLALGLTCALGLVLPSFLLDQRVRTRQRSIELGLPDALDLLVVCIEAGLGLTASIARVAQQYERINPALAEEFELVALESRAGKSNVESLRGLSTRTGLVEVRSLVAMLIQTERFGTSVADALRVHSDSMRTRRMQRAEEGAAKAPIKMLFPAALFIFPATLIVIAGPGMIRLMSTLTGG
jgi:tight adherence protein C